MLEPGIVRAGDELVYEFGNVVKHRQSVKVKRITSESDVIVGSNGKIYNSGIIILESNACFLPNGTPLLFGDVKEELYPLEEK